MTSVIAFRLQPGQDLKQEICRITEQEKISAGCILSTVGSLSRAVLRFAGRGEGMTLTDDYEILSLNGTLSPDGVHLHLTIADENGQVLGGHLLDGCIIRTTTEIIIGVLPDLAFHRELDPATGYRELVVTRKKLLEHSVQPPDTQYPTPNHPTTEQPPHPLPLERGGDGEGTPNGEMPPAPQSPNTGYPLAGDPIPNTQPPTLYILHTDGASKGNPGPSGIGIALFKADDMQNPVAAFGEYLGQTTNNVAEYKALLRGLKEALLRGVAQIEVRTDSQLMAQQVAGKYKVNAPQIVPLHTEATKLLSRFAKARVVYVPREQNSLADKLANQGVAEGTSRR
jgi:predicted DNA-binding protein with PD1-like motif/ribonuclease HI